MPPSKRLKLTGLGFLGGTSVRAPAADRGVSSRSTVLGPVIDRFAPVSPSSSSPLSRWRFGALGSLRSHLGHHRRRRRNAAVDPERELHQILFASPRSVPPAQDLGAILPSPVALDHLVERELLSVHPFEVDPPPPVRLVVAPDRDDPGVRPQARGHNVGDVPSFSGNLLYERSDVR